MLEVQEQRVHIMNRCDFHLVTIAWNPNGFHLIHLLPSGCKFNSSYYRREILELDSEWGREQIGDAGRKLIVHADNARSHTAAASQEFMEENGRERAIHPPHSSDLAPSDFYLIIHVKHCLRGQSFEAADEFFLAIDVILRGPEKWTLYAAFLDWMQRPGQCIEINDDYFE
jgi:hypothetical protein